MDNPMMPVEEKNKIVIITGMSGAGKTQALKAVEDAVLGVHAEAAEQIVCTASAEADVVVFQVAGIFDRERNIRKGKEQHARFDHMALPGAFIYAFAVGDDVHLVHGQQRGLVGIGHEGFINKVGGRELVGVVRHDEFTYILVCHNITTFAGIVSQNCDKNNTIFHASIEIFHLILRDMRYNRNCQGKDLVHAASLQSGSEQFLQ